MRKYDALRGRNAEPVCAEDSTDSDQINLIGAAMIIAAVM